MKDNKNKQKISSLLVGNFNSPPRMSEYISSRRQKLSTPLIGKLRDRDGDLTPDWIDCDPNDPTQHGFWSSAKSAVSKAVSAVKSAVSSGYKSVDKAVGGKLPGGVPSSSGSTPAPSSSTSTSSSKSSGGGGSSGASKVFQQAVSGQSPTIQSAVGMGQSVAPTPAQTTTTKTGSFVPGKGFVTSTGQVYPTSNPSWTPPGYTSTTSGQSSVVITSSGGVKVYNEKGVEQTFTGNAIVPGTGKTANQLQQELIRQGVESGMGTRNLTSYGYYGTPTTTTSTTGTGNNFQAYNKQSGELISLERTPTGPIVQSARNLAYNVGQFFTGENQYIRDPFAPIKTKEVKEQWFGGQPKTETLFFGDKEIIVSDKPIVTPSIYGGTPTITFGEVRDIKADQEVGIVRKIEESVGGLSKIPGFSFIGKASPYISGAFSEEAYLPTKEDADKYADLLEQGNARKLREFLRDQQAELKKDIGKYNSIQAILGATQPTTEEQIKKYNDRIEELNRLQTKISQGYRGTGWDILKGGAEDYTRRGENLNLFGMQVSPGFAAGSLYGATSSYGILKNVLAFQTGAGIAGAALGTTTTGAALLTGAGKLGKGLTGVTFLSGAGLSLGAAVSAQSQYDYTPYAIGGGLGTAAGFFGGIYSRQVVSGVGKAAKSVGRGLKYTGEKIGEFGSMEVSGIKGKRASVQVTRAESEYVYDYSTGRFIKKSQLDLQKVREGLLFKKEGKTVIVKSFNEKLSDIKKVLDKLKNATPQQRSKTFKFLEDVYGRGELNRLISEYTAQEGLSTIRMGRQTARPDTLRFFDSSFTTQTSQPRVSLEPPQSEFFGRGLYERTTATIPKTGLISSVGNRLLLGSLSAFAVGTGVASALDSRTDTTQRSNLLSVSLTGMRTDTIQTPTTRTDTAQDTRTTTLSASGLASSTVTDTATTSGTVFGGISQTRPRVPQPKQPVRPPQFGFSFDFPDERRVKRDTTPYDAFVLRDATKKQKARWEKVADNVPLITALSKGAREADTSPSTQFKVVKDKGKVSQVIDTAWNSLQRKFRSYTQKSGVKVGLRPGRYIESRLYRIDSPGEVAGISRKGQASIGRRFGRL